MSFLEITVLVGSLLLIAHSLFSMYVMLYAWDKPEALVLASVPEQFREPRLSFSVLLPARDEEAVIYETVVRICSANYPPELLEVIVVCHAEDEATIREAERAARAMDTLSDGRPRVVVETFSTEPQTKPHGLNVALRRARHDVVTIFDAEDDISPDIFDVINTVMLSEGVGIVQAGVQLVNYQDHWFSFHNALEYFFHFKSRMLYFAGAGMMPLGGNTVFFRRALLESIGGWDERSLTEDAEIGVRLSALGERTRIVYHPRYVTREETPDSVSALVRQRTRWHQGFLQVLLKPHWRGLPTLWQRLLAVFVFTAPLIQAALTLVAIPAIIGGFWLRTRVWVVLISYLPLYPLLFQLVITGIGARMYTREYGLRLHPTLLLRLLVTFLPYHVLMGVSAIRAVSRQFNGLSDWEKTGHVGAHRAPETPETVETDEVAPACSPAVSLHASEHLEAVHES